MTTNIITDLEKQIDKLHKRNEHIVEESIKERFREARREFNGRSSYSNYTSIKKSK